MIIQLRKNKGSPYVLFKIDEDTTFMFEPRDDGPYFKLHKKLVSMKKFFDCKVDEIKEGIDFESNKDDARSIWNEMQDSGDWRMAPPF
jgi:hypothetical protein